jgi:hypothetical protein
MSVAAILLFKCAAPLNPNPGYNLFSCHTPVGTRSSSVSASMPYRPPPHRCLADRSSSVSTSMSCRPPPRRRLANRFFSAYASTPRRPHPHRHLTDHFSSESALTPHGPPPRRCRRPPPSLQNKSPFYNTYIAMYIFMHCKFVSVSSFRVGPPRKFGEKGCSP